MPILGTKPIEPENRFGVSLQYIQSFKYRLTHTIRNEQAVRTKWEVEWQTEEQSKMAKRFLHEVIANKEILQQATSRSEIRPIPAQWKHLMAKLKDNKVFHDFIELSRSKLTWIIPTKIQNQHFSNINFYIQTWHFGVWLHHFRP